MTRPSPPVFKTLASEQNTSNYFDHQIDNKITQKMQ